MSDSSIALLMRRCRYQPRCTIAGSGSWLARANDSGAQCCCDNTHHRPSQPPRKHSPDSAARARKQTSDYSLLLRLSTSKYERLSRPAWLATYRNKVPPPGVEPGHVTHPSTNRAQRRVTSLIRPTPLPLRHAPTQSNTAITHRKDNRKSSRILKIDNFVIVIVSHSRHQHLLNSVSKTECHAITLLKCSILFLSHRQKQNVPSSSQVRITNVNEQRPNVHF